MPRPATAAILTHVPYEGPGEIGRLLAADGIRIVHYPLYAGAAVPGPAETDILVVMGGPMSVNDERELPWLGREVRAIREHLAAKTPIIGVCLGAQLIAKALGARVYRNPQPEIGWWPVQKMRKEPGDCASAGVVMAVTSDPWQPVFEKLPAQATVFHWHGETFDLPNESTLRMSSTMCRNQVFTVGDRVIGLQFHVEMTRQGVGALASVAGNECRASTYTSVPFGSVVDFMERGWLRHSGLAAPFLAAVVRHLRTVRAQ